MMMGASSLGGFPFTSAQWKELERQAMIYKYMTASLPVPPELLIPITRNLSDSASSPHCNNHNHNNNHCSLICFSFDVIFLFLHSYGFDVLAFWAVGRGVFNLRFSNGGADPEPGRCRRTDGKKWRCAKDVAPNQKYCERHMHRGRPRSRKPVEVVHAAAAAVDGSSHKKIRHCHAPTPPPPPSPILSNHLCSQSQFLGSAGLDQYHQNSVFLYKSDHKSPPPFSPLIVSVPPFKETRSDFFFLFFFFLLFSCLIKQRTSSLEKFSVCRFLTFPTSKRIKIMEALKVDVRRIEGKLKISLNLVYILIIYVLLFIQDTNLFIYFF